MTDEGPSFDPAHLPVVTLTTKEEIQDLIDNLMQLLRATTADRDALALERDALLEELKELRK